MEIGGGAGDDERRSRAVIFTYGTLKRGFPNHGLLEELFLTGDASLVGPARTCERLPLVCGPYRVPFLINLPGSGEHVRGELYSASPKALARMDDLEGTCRGHYERLPIKVEREDGGELFEAEAYYAHRSYAGELWTRSGERGYANYSVEEAKGYVKRNDRPQGVTFLDRIRILIFVASDN